MRSADRNVDNLCAIAKVVRPLVRLAIASCIFFSVGVSSEEVASSRIRIRGIVEDSAGDRDALLLAA